MLHSVIRASMPSASTAAPANSMAWPRPPAAPWPAIIASAMSLAVTPAGSTPSKVTRSDGGRLMRSVPVASACSASVDPMPHASAPTAPCVQVWLSGATSVSPGSTSPSSGDTTWTMPWSGWPMSNRVMPAAAQAARVSVMNAVPPGIVVASPRPGIVSTIWSIAAKARAGSATLRPAAERLLSAAAPVRSWRKIRSMAMIVAPPGVSAMACAFHNLSKRLGIGLAALGPPFLHQPRRLPNCDASAILQDTRHRVNPPA